MVGLKRKKEKKFSTFANIARGDLERWIEDPRLKQSMDKEQSLLQWGTDESFPVHAWVAHWHKDWKSEQTKLPRYHLHAYLQEPCYWAAKRISSRFKTTTFGLADCFQTAFEKSDIVLERFRPELGNSLSTYAGRAFLNAIQDALGQYNEVQISSELSLLHRCGIKRLEKALTSAGLLPEIQATHKAAWRSFQAFYFPQATTARNLTSLVPEDWTMMLAHYEILRLQQNLDSASEAKLQEWLTNCVLHLRRYIAPQSLSLNADMDDSEEFLEKLEDSQTESMTLLIAQEREAEQQERQQKMTAALRAGLLGLKPSNQQLLQLYYGDQLNQTEIATKLGIKQYTVSRQLSRTRQALLKVLVTWSLEELHISCDPAVLNNMTAILDDWLKAQFSGERN